MGAPLLGFVLLAVLWWSGTAAATPAFGPQVQVATMTPGGTALDLTNADFTGDGRQDVLVLRGRWASEGEYPISILVNDGAAGFTDKAPELFGGPVPRAVWPRQALIADFNGDGRPDIFIGDSGIDQAPWPGHANDLALSTPAGGYVDASANLPSDVRYFHSGAAGDVDSDGDADIFLADLGTPIRLLVNDGTGRFATASGRFPGSVLAFGHERYTRSALVDVNSDGRLDLVLLAEEHNPSSTVLLNDGRGFFTELANSLPAKPFGPDAIGIAIQAVNLNGDAHPDLMLGYTKGNPWYVGRWIQMAVNNGDGTFRDETAARQPQEDNAFDWPYEIVLGDLDSDASVDFGIDIGSNFCCPGKRVAAPLYLNRGNGTFAPLDASAFAEPPYGQLRLIDVNGDGRLDVFGVWQAMPWDAPERYVVQLQLPQGGGGGGGGAGVDGDGDGVPDAGDRCPTLVRRTANGCPGATLTRTRRVRTSRAGRAIRVDTGVDAACPPAGVVCRGSALLKAKRPRRRPRMAARKPLRLRSAVLRVSPGVTSRLAFRLSARGAAALRKARRLRTKIAIELTGPDGAAVTLNVKATLIAPKRQGGS